MKDSGIIFASYTDKLSSQFNLTLNKEYKYIFRKLFPWLLCWTRLMSEHLDNVAQVNIELKTSTEVN